MKPPKLILDHITDPESFAYCENKLTNLSKGMAVAMLATGMTRLSTFYDFKQFFIRMGIFYHEEGIIETFFSKDEIFCSLFDGTKIKASVDQIINYKGIMLDSGMPESTFDEWLNEVNNQYLILKVMRMKRDHQYNDYTYKELLNYFSSSIKMNVTDEIIGNAQLMADIIMSEIDSSIFEH